MSRRTLRIITGSLVGATALALAGMLALPRFAFWALERYADRVGGLQ